MAIRIESAGRRKDGALYVEGSGHHYWSQERNGTIHANYHGNPGLLPHPFKRECCTEFEKYAELELSGLKMLDEFLSDLEE